MKACRDCIAMNIGWCCRALPGINTEVCCGVVAAEWRALEVYGGGYLASYLPRVGGEGAVVRVVSLVSCVFCSVLCAYSFW